MRYLDFAVISGASELKDVDANSIAIRLNRANGFTPSGRCDRFASRGYRGSLKVIQSPERPLPPGPSATTPSPLLSALMKTANRCLIPVQSAAGDRIKRINHAPNPSLYHPRRPRLRRSPSVVHPRSRIRRTRKFGSGKREAMDRSSPVRLSRNNSASRASLNA